MPAADIDTVTARLRAAGCVFAEQEARLLVHSARSPHELADLVARRIAGNPLEHLLGWTEFENLRIGLRPGVFVPRRRSALLVQEALALARADPPRTVVDLCCGSGALGLALLTALAGHPAPPPDLYATDIDTVAADCARTNLAPFGGQVYQGDLFDALPARLRGQIDIVLANTPYVPSDQLARMPPEARDHEPRTALDGGPDGLDLARRVAATAPAWLAPGGRLLIEIGTDQAPAATAILREHGFVPRIAESTDLGATVAIGLPATATSGR